MGVSTIITVEAPTREKALEGAAAAYGRIGEIEDAASDYRPQSEVMRLCRGETARVGEWVEVSGDLWRLLRVAREVSEVSDGAFDVTVGPAVGLWRAARQSGMLPAKGLLADARSRIDWRFVEVDLLHTRVRLLREGMKIDFGGIAKGYAAQEAVSVLTARGLPRCLVALAGDVCAGEAPSGGGAGGQRERGWVVELRGEKSERVIGRVWLRDAVVSTSGDVEQFVELEGVRYSHIVDPRTGVGVVGGRVVTVIGERGAAVDAAATAAVVMEVGGFGLQALAARCGVTLIAHRSDGAAEVIGDGRRVTWVVPSE